MWPRSLDVLIRQFRLWLAIDNLGLGEDIAGQKLSELRGPFKPIFDPTITCVVEFMVFVYKSCLLMFTPIRSSSMIMCSGIPPSLWPRFRIA